MPNISDDSLIRQLVNEENAAFDRLYEESFPSIAKFVTYNSGSAQDAEDIFQEAVLPDSSRQPALV